ncbi:aspartate kinase [Peribacillus deserti]|uniref:Aspartokinase n=1 Tax=Peribacillus deserti TaxID=673318 RepID=A0A2N5MBZ6_9BACI|nr:aspartate kinase [Peribacillus deserti]PLT31876.1 aspartate kinase [Peribacillus deserti]
MKVVKFGGSSLASGEQFEKVYHIVLSDAARKIIVVSAPGKRHKSDKKVTDLLIENADYYLTYREINEGLLEQVVGRFYSIAVELGIYTDIISDIRADIIARLTMSISNNKKYMDRVKAGGEDNTARLLAAYFNSKGKEAHYINPLEAGLFVTDQPGNAQVLAESYENLASLKEKSGILVFPGFFGYSKSGEILTFSRSGSDITGSILANAIHAELYENFTDVDAVYSVNPITVRNPKEIRELTYREMRELSYAGFSVLHDEALIPAYRAGIPVHIKNTNNPSAPGTKIVNQRTITNGPVIGIASAKGFCSIYVSKYLMNRELGFGRKLLQILEDFNLSYEHSPSGIDDISIILRQNEIGNEMEEAIRNRVFTELEADEVKIERNLALIMIVGEGMRHNVGTTARASRALAHCGVNIEMINQGSSEVSMMFGVKEVDEDRAVHSLYEEFFVSVSV